MNKQTRTVLWAVLPLLFLVAVGTCQGADYYTGIGTSNLEKGVHEPYFLEIGKLTQVHVAQVINTGTVNLSMKIVSQVTFTDGNVTLNDPSECVLEFYGVEEYTRTVVEYPFFLEPQKTVNVWANVTLDRIGNYSFIFNWDVTPIPPTDFPSGTSLSTPGGKATAKFNVGVSTAGAFQLWSLLPYMLTGIGVSGGGIAAFIVIKKKGLPTLNMNKPLHMRLNLKKPSLKRHVHTKPEQEPAAPTAPETSETVQETPQATEDSTQKREGLDSFITEQVKQDDAYEEYRKVWEDTNET